MPSPRHLPSGQRQIGSEQLRWDRRIGDMEIAQRKHAGIKLQGVDAPPKYALRPTAFAADERRTVVKLFMFRD